MSEETVEKNESAKKALSVGELVAAAREERGLDRAALARAVHLNVAFLAAIEEGRWKDLPGDTYARGYIISLCAELGLQKHEMLEKYASETHRENLETLDDSQPAFRTHEDELNDKPRKVPVALLVLLAGVALAVVSFIGQQEPAAEEPAPAAEAEPAPEGDGEDEESAAINESLGAPDSLDADTSSREPAADTARAPSLARPSSASAKPVSAPVQAIPTAKSRVLSRLDISCDKDSAWIEIRSPGVETWASWIRQDGPRYTQTRSDTMYIRTGSLPNLNLKLNHLAIQPKRSEFVVFGGQLVR